MTRILLNDDDPHDGHTEGDGHVDDDGDAIQNCRISEYIKAVCTDQHESRIHPCRELGGRKP